MYCKEADKGAQRSSVSMASPGLMNKNQPLIPKMSVGEEHALGYLAKEQSVLSDGFEQYVHRQLHQSTLLKLKREQTLDNLKKMMFNL